MDKIADVFLLCTYGKWNKLHHAPVDLDTHNDIHWVLKGTGENNHHKTTNKDDLILKEYKR